MTTADVERGYGLVAADEDRRYDLTAAGLDGPKAETAGVERGNGLAAPNDLERAYRRWLRWYPASFRREYEAEMLGVLLAGARAGQRRPAPLECLDLLRGALCLRLRPCAPGSDRSVVAAVKLMYLGAAVELATAIMIVATIGDIRANVIRSNPGLTVGQWHAIVAGQLEPLAVSATIAVGFWLWMAWSIGHGQRWARIAFALFFALNTWSLLHGLAGGSAVYARPDLAVASILWLVELAAVALLFRLKMAVAAPDAHRTTSEG